MSNSDLFLGETTGNVFLLYLGFLSNEFTVHRTVREGGGFTNTNVSAGWLLHSAYLCTWPVTGLEPENLWFPSAKR